MAKLGAPWPWKDVDWHDSDWLAKQDAQFKEIEGQCLGIYRTPVADGHAVYAVTSIKPLTLRHIPVGDAWHAHPALIRGLRAEDVKELWGREKRWAEMVAKVAPGNAGDGNE